MSPGKPCEKTDMLYLYIYNNAIWWNLFIPFTYFLGRYRNASTKLRQKIVLLLGQEDHVCQQDPSHQVYPETCEYDYFTPQQINCKHFVKAA